MQITRNLGRRGNNWPERKKETGDDPPARGLCGGGLSEGGGEVVELELLELALVRLHLPPPLLLVRHRLRHLLPLCLPHPEFFWEPNGMEGGAAERERKGRGRREERNGRVRAPGP